MPAARFHLDEPLNPPAASFDFSKILEGMAYRVRPLTLCSLRVAVAAATGTVHAAGEAMPNLIRMIARR
jgi:hypothetical protein